MVEQVASIASFSKLVNDILKHQGALLPLFVSNFIRIQFVFRYSEYYSFSNSCLLKHIDVFSWKIWLGFDALGWTVSKVAASAPISSTWLRFCETCWRLAVVRGKSSLESDVVLYRSTVMLFSFMMEGVEQNQCERNLSDVSRNLLRRSRKQLIFQLEDDVSQSS